MTSNTLTLAEVAATSLHATRILESHGLDYCCGGKQPLESACQAKGLSPESILAEIESASLRPGADRDWKTAPLHELVRHIVSTHHEYLKLELPAIAKRMEKVLAVHGARDPEMLPRVAAIYRDLHDELSLHLHKEEVILFPFIEQYGRAAAQGQPLPPVPFGSIANPIHVMEHEHAGAGGLARIRELTGNYALPSYACTTFRALFASLQALEADLHVHIHLENNILFPRAIALEQA